MIEIAPDGVYDVNGWELTKAVRLLVKGNATIIEWLRSPIRYHDAPLLRIEFLELANRVADRTLIGRHYLHVGILHWQRVVSEDLQSVVVKKLFYSLRPALALRWLRQRPNAPHPPMDVPTLLAESDPPPAVRSITEEMIELKARIREQGTSPLPRRLAEFITAEFDLAEASLLNQDSRDQKEVQALAVEFHRRWTLESPSLEAVIDSVQCSLPCG